MSLKVVDSVPPNDKPLSRKQETFVAACLTLPSYEAAARAAGVSGKTAHTWLKDERVQAAIEAARTQAYDHALHKLQDMTEEAIDKLCSVMRDTEAPLSLRIRAAAILLEKSIDMHVLRELKSELATIKLLGGSTQGRRIG